MAITAREGREQIVDDLAAAVGQLGLSRSCLGAAYEQLAVDSADRLEATLFRPAQKAFGRGKRALDQFAGRHSITAPGLEPPSTGPPSQGVKALVERALVAATEADRRIAELQDSMLPIEYGDAELRAGLAEARELLAGLPTATREFLRTLGR